MQTCGYLRFCLQWLTKIFEVKMGDLGSNWQEKFLVTDKTGEGRLYFHGLSYNFHRISPIIL